MNTPDVWQSFFGEQLPISYLLREKNKDVWLRIHSLPASKRYAEDEAEMQEVLRRHNIVAAEVLKENAACLWFLPNYAVEELSSAYTEMEFASFVCHHEGEWGTKITQWALQTVWEQHKFDPLLRFIANDKIRYVSWMNVESGEVFAPYDGGADLFLNSTQRRDQLRARYSDWLSSYTEGL